MKDQRISFYRVGLVVVSVCLATISNHQSLCRLDGPPPSQMHRAQRHDVAKQASEPRLRKGAKASDFLQEEGEAEVNVKEAAAVLHEIPTTGDLQPAPQTGATISSTIGDNTSDNSNRSNTWPPKQMIEDLLAMDSLSPDNAKKGTTSRRRMVVAASNSDFVDFADNFAHSMLSLNVTNFVLVPLDAGAYEKLHQAYPRHTLPVMPADLHHITVPNGTADFGGAAFQQLTATRPIFLQAFLEHGYSVLYNDIDMVWQHNAWSVIDERDVNRNVAVDGNVATPTEMATIATTTTAMIWHDGKGDQELCTCLLYLHPTEADKALVQRWHEEIATGTQPDDQQAFNVVARQMQLPFAGGTMSTPDGHIQVFANDEQFPPGSRFAWHDRNDARNQQAVIVHNNWVYGKSNKRKRFESAGLWKPSGRLSL